MICNLHTTHAGLPERTLALKYRIENIKCVGISEEENGLIEEQRNINTVKKTQEYTELVRGCQPHLGPVIMIKEEITSWIKVSPADHPVIKQAKEMIARNIEKRLPVSDTMKVAALLDPFMKDAVELSLDEKIDLLVRSYEDNVQ